MKGTELEYARISRAWPIPSQAAAVFALAVAVAVALAGCTQGEQTAMRCEDVLHPALWSVSFGELDAGNVQDWISAHFPGANMLRNDATDFAWSSDAKEFAAHVDPTYRYIAQYPTSFSAGDSGPALQEPAIADVLRCFGKPDLYALQDIPAEVWQIGFSMWYLDRGLIFKTTESKGLIPKQYDLTTTLHGPFLAVPRGSAEEMTASWLTTDPATVAAQMAELEPWPERFSIASRPSYHLADVIVCAAAFLIILEIAAVALAGALSLARRMSR